MPGARDETFAVRVAARTEVATGVVQLDLVADGAATLPTWAPGAHIDLILDNGLTRQYSLCGDPDDAGRYRVAVLREQDGRGGSLFVHERIGVGDRIRVRGPRNNFDLTHAERYLFIAGGVGITPLLPMIAAVRRCGASWRLVYGGRARDAMAYVAELELLPEVQIVPQDRAGLLDLERLADEHRDDLVYCCGPESLLAAAQAAFAGLPRGSFRYERFAAARDTGSAGTDSSFMVEIASTGDEFEVGPEDSVLGVLLEAGVDVPYSCEDGVCGSCETVVLRGRPDHRDAVMSPEEHEAAGTMQLCVSRSLDPRLVLDL
jgi:ferredoxin-NADP reductase